MNTYDAHLMLSGDQHVTMCLTKVYAYFGSWLFLKNTWAECYEGDPILGCPIGSGQSMVESPCSRASRVCKLCMVVGLFWLGWMLVGALNLDSLHASVRDYLPPRRVSYIPGATRKFFKCRSYVLVESLIWLPLNQTLSQPICQQLRFRSWPWPDLWHSCIVYNFLQW